MSVIVATARYMLGDRRISTDDAIHPPMIKVFRNAHLMAGVAGNCISILAIQAAVELHEARSLEQLRELVDSDSEALVVLNRRIYRLSNEKGRELRGPQAIGSGGQIVLGFLAASKAVNPGVCRRAMRYAFTTQPSCGDGIDVIHAPS